MSAKKVLTLNSVNEVLARIEQGAKPDREINQGEFVKRLLPQIQALLQEQYSYKEIATFIGSISATELKKLVEKSIKKSEPATQPPLAAKNAANSSKTPKK